MATTVNVSPDGRLYRWVNASTAAGEEKTVNINATGGSYLSGDTTSSMYTPLAVNGTVTVNQIAEPSRIWIGNPSGNATTIGKTGNLIIKGNGKSPYDYNNSISVQSSWNGTSGNGGFINNGTLTISNATLSSSGNVYGQANGLSSGKIMGTINLINSRGTSDDPKGKGTEGYPMFGNVVDQRINMTGSSFYAAGVLNNVEFNMIGEGNRIDLIPNTTIVQNITVNGFGNGNVIDVSSSAYPNIYAYDDKNGILTIKTVRTNGYATYNINIGKGYDPDLFSLISLTTGGTQGVTYNGPVPCYLAGTRIRTPSGEVMIEDLRVGDEIVVRRDGGLGVEIVTAISSDEAVVNTTVPPDIGNAPVKICAGTFGENQPSQDTFVTPEHCVFVGDYLVPIRMLINDVNIFYDSSLESYRYYHISTAKHELIYANGMISETLFRSTLTGSVVAQRAAPLLSDLREAHRLYRAVAGIKKDKKYLPNDTLNQDGRIYLSDGQRQIFPARKSPTGIVFMIPSGVRALVLHSDSVRPADSIGPFVDDRRRLGLLVGHISFFHSTGQVDITAHLQNCCLYGWNSYEGSTARWTTGETPLSIPELPANEVGILSIEILEKNPLKSLLPHLEAA